MADPLEVLDRSTRCVLAFSGDRGPLVALMAFWSDGSSLWMSTPAVSMKAAALRRRAQCSVYVPPPDGGGAGIVLAGRARVYGLHDPLGLAVHGAVVSTAMTALAAGNAGTILDYVQNARFVPNRFRPRNRVAVRFSIDESRPVRAPDPGPGVAPALPPVVPGDIRRAVTGQRRVVLATGLPSGTVSVTPAVWAAGFSLQLPRGDVLPAAGPATVYAGTDPRQRPIRVVGLSLMGELDGERLKPHRATWWEGCDLRTVDLPSTSSVVIPE
ncbi:MAG: hypothetical protein GEU74_09090 [Nitriliruptorales bacterium]|nr:hypothetical protein [Nitriliruptorales bacterium]